MAEKLSMRLQCPVPKMDFDVIQLGHGSGGLMTHRLLKSGVFEVLQNEFLREEHDGSIVDLTGKTAITTDSFVVSPVFFPGGNIGDLAINGTVNDLAMCGAKPQYLTLACILEEGFALEDYWEILLTIREAGKAAGVQIVTGDTKVVEKGKGDGIFINTTGIGLVHPQADISVSKIRAGDVVVVSGLVASHGMAILSVREGLEFETTLKSDTAPVHDMVWALLDQFGPEIRFLRDPTRGGLASTLNEAASQRKIGIQLEQNSIPMLDEVEGACELLGMDPLYVANEGIFIAIVAPEIADQTVAKLRQFPLGKHASIIGRVVNDNPGQVVLNSSIGGKRVVAMLAGEQLPRIC
ncbi:MAG TPA: hydrogenase expression/formation protein HypE [Saprospiraceae bacterium]|nr:hydrogenase expression/formation protein HypE [Saprospiraceae bacterium]